MPDPSQLGQDIAQVLAKWMGATTSEFQAGDVDPNDSAREIKRGRRTTVPLSTSGVGIYSGQLFTDPRTQPQPTSIVRSEQDLDERDITVYLAWAVTPGLVQPIAPIVLAYVQWGVGGVTYARMLDLHRMPRRLSLVAHWVQVQALYLDTGESGVEAGVDVIASIGTGESAPEFWAGTWFGPDSATSAQNVTTDATVLLAAAGTLTDLGGTAGPWYWMAVDTKVAPGAGDVPIPGTVSPPLTAVGSTFAFSELSEPDTFADFGLAWVLSSDPTVYAPPGEGGIPLAVVQVKFAMGTGT